MRRTIVDAGTFLADAADAMNIAPSEAEVSDIPISTQTMSSYIPEKQEPMITNEAARDGMEGNGMEWEKRPMLGGQRVYLQNEADVLMSTGARK